MLSSEKGRDFHFAVALRGRLSEEPANKSDPESVEAGSPEHPHNPERNEREPNTLADSCGKPGGLVRIAGLPPYGRAEDPPPVQRVTRNQVKDPEAYINVAEPYEHCHYGRAPARARSPTAQQSRTQTQTAD